MANNQPQRFIYVDASSTTPLNRCTSAVENGTSTPDEKARNEQLQRKKSIAQSLAKLDREEEKRNLRNEMIDAKWEKKINKLKREMNKDNTHYSLVDFPQSKLQIKMENMERWVKSKVRL